MTLQVVPEREMYEAMRVKSKFLWRPQEMPGLWSICPEQTQEMIGRQHMREATWAANGTSTGLGLPVLTEDHTPQILDMELQDLICALMRFGLALV
jgi:hypothetical protein